MSRFDDYVLAHEQLFAHYNDLVGRLSDDELALRSLCPEWDIRQVIAHAVGVEYWLTGWEPSDQSPPPFERMSDFERRLAGAGRSTLAEVVAETTATRLHGLERLGPDVLDRPSFTPAGVATYGRFLQIRVFDMWVHARDIAIPLGEPMDDSGFNAETALQEVDDSSGYIVGKKIGLPDGKSIAFRIRGAVERDILVKVVGRATRVEQLPAPDVEVVTDVGTFVMLAAGRIDPGEQIAAGTITWSGDVEWGEVAARNLAYTT